MIFPKRMTAVALCILLLDLPVLGGPRPADQRAGQIDALIPAATRNDVAAKAKDDLDWNDLLKTAKSGRIRASLLDGSILSVGSSSELRVVEHDAATQQTSLEVGYGKLRSQVEKITKDGGKFEVKTPNAVIGAIGTDFYVAYLGHKTTVICYKGQVLITPTGNVQILRSGRTNSSSNSLTVNEGQMVVVSTVLPPPSDTPPSVQQATLLATDVPPNAPGEVRPGGTGGAHTWIFIGAAAAIGTAIGVVATHGSTHPATH